MSSWTLILGYVINLIGIPYITEVHIVAYASHSVLPAHEEGLEADKAAVVYSISWEDTQQDQ